MVIRIQNTCAISHLRGKPEQECYPTFFLMDYLSESGSVACLGLNRLITNIGAKACKFQPHTMRVIIFSFYRKSSKKIYSENSCTDRVRAFVRTLTHSDSGLTFRNCVIANQMRPKCVGTSWTWFIITIQN